jgi:hypothetical protein
VSVGIALSDSRGFTSAAALAQAAAEMKTVAKRQIEGRVATDRRHSRVEARSEAHFRRA